ncbi:hypothetical protein CSB45_06930 [candidate division KSB3 bacterium]|uniref:MIP18 family-like domain-containing protein n=1 Tax=candidate division KSB3 bacterium TaxID=2044937 RepID=A0A2G6E647_9BACT|nr:MAG: hypothetical protein CSB45_06930 [candidate division KSB3 bacterium]PIE30031.1 MAG: hypothetical protein CSA57_05665 [candidate division KSB3 bacterium]
MVTRKEILDLLRTIHDPETDMNIVELCLVNDVQIRDGGATVIVDMGFQRKNPDCKACIPLAWYIQGKIIQKIERAVSRLPGVGTVEVLSN